MSLTRLRLYQFRCFDNVTIDVPGDARMIAFVGPNAAGKTSILEAVCVLLRLQSPRASAVGELIRFGEEKAAVEGAFGDATLRWVQSAKTRRLTVDGERCGRSADYLAHSGLVVWLGNDDILLIRGGGEGRRRFLDFVGSQLFAEYRPSLRAYERALRSRNYLLKKPSVSESQLAAYAAVMVDHGEKLIAMRRALIEKLVPFADTAQRSVSGRDEPLELVYAPSVVEGTFSAALSQSADEERRKKSTVVGPHRDDFEMALCGMPVGQFGSEGQQRTAVLSLKLAQAELLKSHCGRPPVILIDDVFGELDPERRQRFVDQLPDDSPRWITTTNLDWADDALLEKMVRYNVRDGEVIC